MSFTRVAVWSSAGVFGAGVAYVIVLAIGSARYGSSQPIGDPILAIMEALTLLSAPLMLVMMVAVYACAQPHNKAYGLLAVIFMALVVGTTGAVHFVGLTALRQLGAGSLEWPSPAYALELLAWDLFLGLSLICGAFALEAVGANKAIRHGLLISGSLCLLGIIGPAVGDMRLQRLGIVGYAVVLPVVSLLIARWLRGAGTISLP